MLTCVPLGYLVFPCVTLSDPVLPCVTLCDPVFLCVTLYYSVRPCVPLCYPDCFIVLPCVPLCYSVWPWDRRGVSFSRPRLVSRPRSSPLARSWTPVLKSEGCSQSTDIYVALLSLCLHRLFKQARGNSSYDRQRRLAAHWWCWALWWTWILLHCGSNQRTDQVQRISG